MINHHTEIYTPRQREMTETNKNILKFSLKKHFCYKHEMFNGVGIVFCVWSSVHAYHLGTYLVLLLKAS